jgi:hypothetical protein
MHKIGRLVHHLSTIITESRCGETQQRVIATTPNVLRANEAFIGTLCWIASSSQAWLRPGVTDLKDGHRRQAPPLQKGPELPFMLKCAKL